MKVFEKYLLNEMIKPIVTEYGTNNTLDDRNWISQASGIRTYFEFNDRVFVFDLSDSGEFSFGTAKSKSTDKSKLQDLYYTRSIFTTAKMNFMLNSSGIFNRIFYIMIQALQKKSPKILKFSASLENANDLGSFYDFLIQNKQFKTEINKIGYDVYGKVHNDYVIRKI